MRLLDAVADRLVAAVVPKAVARAVGCSDTYYTIFCEGCHERTYSSKVCCDGPDGNVYCGPCIAHRC